MRGRTTVLRVNYRNTREIITAAMAVAGGQPVDDLGDEYARGDADAVAVRDGLKPILVSADSHEQELKYVIERATDLVRTGAVGAGDLAVAVATNRQVGEVAHTLRRAGMTTQKLDDYDGTPTDAVKVGTHFRIKGLEFKVVFLPFLGEEDFPRRRAPGQSEAEYEEARTRAVAQLFVAMTRARDGLFVLCTGHPSREIAHALDRFELVDA